MPSIAICEYLDATENRKIRDDLLFAINHVKAPKIAIDCGCGAGADIDYLASNGFTVHGFDIDEASISRCQARFQGMGNVTLSQSTFAQYRYPKVSLVVADASLFFCPEAEFPTVWNNIHDCLYPNGIFCGSLLGPEDTMAGPAYNKDDYWPEVTAFEEDEARVLFADYEILRFTVHKSAGVTPTGDPHHWHIYSVVARKPDDADSH